MLLYLMITSDKYSGIAWITYCILVAALMIQNKLFTVLTENNKSTMLMHYRDFIT